MFRSLILSLSSLLSITALFAQRPSATFINGNLVRLDLDGQRVFVDAPLSGKSITDADIALYVTVPAAEPVSTLTFSPSLAGGDLEKRSAEVGERTEVYVYPRPTQAGTAPHLSYLVQWKGRRMWFCGDTEDPTEMMATNDIDVAFVSRPWWSITPPTSSSDPIRSACPAIGAGSYCPCPGR